MPDLRSLPSVEQLLQTPVAKKLIADYGRPLSLEALRATLEKARKRFPEEGVIPGREELLASACELLEEWTAPTLLPVINASGVILHTNLGRAPLSAAALQAVREVSVGY